MSDLLIWDVNVRSVKGCNTISPSFVIRQVDESGESDEEGDDEENDDGEEEDDDGEDLEDDEEEEELADDAVDPNFRLGLLKVLQQKNAVVGFIFPLVSLSEQSKHANCS